MSTGAAPAQRSAERSRHARETALAAVRAASALCAAVSQELIAAHATSKADRSPVTVADLGSQALISMALRDAFPDDPIVGEEDGALLRADPEGPIATQVRGHLARAGVRASGSEVADALDRCAHPGGPTGRFWTLDPVDGTKGFLRGGQYAVALALVEDGAVVMGVLGCPNLPLETSARVSSAGCLFFAERGGGSWMYPLAGGPPTALTVAEPPSAAGARMAESVEPAHSALEEGDRVASILGLMAPPLHMDSQAKYATVARGEAHIYLRLPTSESYRERIWDHAAGWLLVHEAGGNVTDVNGDGFDFSCGSRLERNAGVLATSGGALHRKVLEAIVQARER